MSPSQSTWKRGAVSEEAFAGTLLGGGGVAERSSVSCWEGVVETVKAKEEGNNKRKKLIRRRNMAWGKRGRNMASSE